MFLYMVARPAGRGLRSICLSVLAVFLSSCSDKAPVPRPGTAMLMPTEFKGIYLGMEKEEVDRFFTVDGTHLTDAGLETVTRFTRDSVEIGLAFAYRDGRLSVATAWYDYSAVPHRVNPERRTFLDFVIDRNGLDYQRCSFDMPGVEHVPDIGLCWDHPGCQVVVTFSKPSYYFPDSLEFKPYFQFCISDSVTTSFDLWPNIIIPADDPERRYFHEVDSLREVIRTRMGYRQ